MKKPIKTPQQFLNKKLKPVDYQWMWVALKSGYYNLNDNKMLKFMEDMEKFVTDFKENKK